MFGYAFGRFDVFVAVPPVIAFCAFVALFCAPAPVLFAPVTDEPLVICFTAVFAEGRALAFFAAIGAFRVVDGGAVLDRFTATFFDGAGSALGPGWYPWPAIF